MRKKKKRPDSQGEPRILDFVPIYRSRILDKVGKKQNRDRNENLDCLADFGAFVNRKKNLKKKINSNIDDKALINVSEENGKLVVNKSRAFS